MASTREKPSFIFSVRFLLAIVAFIAYAVQYTQKINMSVAIVCMINNTALKEMAHDKDDSQSIVNSLTTAITPVNDSIAEDICYFKEIHKKKVIDGPFSWEKKVQGMILSAYFIGYLITEIPGGWLALKLGSKRILALAILISSILTILTPLASNFSWIALIVVRSLAGACHGVIWPAFSGFWASWAPPDERSRLIGLANAGAQIGNAIALPLGGYLCVNGFAGGWPSIFYTLGAFGFVWFILWMVLASDSPDNNKFIRDREREYILDQTKEIVEAHKEGESNAPWKDIMISKPCIALYVGHSCSNWGTYLYLTSLPLYMKEVLKFDIKSSGGLAALPYFAFWLFIVLSGILGDTLIQKCNWTKTKVRKVFNAIGFIVPMAAVLGLTMVTCAIPYAGVALLTIGLSFTGCCYGAGFLVNYNDIAGTYSGVVLGIGNTFATLPGIIAPFLVGLITKNNLQSEWRIVFIITAVVYLVGGIFLFIFTSAKLQPWATSKKAAGNNEEEVALNQTNMS